mmetsp:Transcript_2873/g.5932  ORF Transcript_2873/g.5932 Transcript_2873/m.5932 type:complete len:304 (-) Transcript_2873:727-1638(-)
MWAICPRTCQRACCASCLKIAVGSRRLLSRSESRKAAVRLAALRTSVSAAQRPLHVRCACLGLRLTGTGCVWRRSRERLHRGTRARSNGHSGSGHVLAVGAERLGASRRGRVDNRLGTRRKFSMMVSTCPRYARALVKWVKRRALCVSRALRTLQSSVLRRLRMTCLSVKKRRRRWSRRQRLLASLVLARSSRWYLSARDCARSVHTTSRTARAMRFAPWAFRSTTGSARGAASSLGGQARSQTNGRSSAATRDHRSKRRGRCPTDSCTRRRLGRCCSGARGFVSGACLTKRTRCSRISLPAV